MSDKPKLPMDDPRYKIPGTNMINFSKWSRENEEHPDHKFAVGDIVVLTITVEISELIRDCDGTPLYRFGDIRGNWSEESLRAATDEEIENY